MVLVEVDELGTRVEHPNTGHIVRLAAGTHRIALKAGILRMSSALNQPDGIAASMA